MEFKEGSEAIPIFIKPRRSGVVVTMQAFVDSYSSGFDPTLGTYELNASTADKAGMEVIPSVSTDDDGMFFTLPATMFEDSQRTWTVILKFIINGITDFALYNFDIKVTKGDSPNSR